MNLRKRKEGETAKWKREGVGGGCCLWEDLKEKRKGKMRKRKQKEKKEKKVQKLATEKFSERKKKGGGGGITSKKGRAKWEK